MIHNLCPLCRRSMRLWAMDARFAPTPGQRAVCVRTATSYREECRHADREKYEALVAHLKRLAPGDWRHTAIWREIERIKNCTAGQRPVGRTFNAWQPRRLG